MKRAHRLSFSRLLACLWWARGDVECPDDPPGRPARVGTIVHRLSEERAGGRPFDKSTADPHELAEALSIFHGPLAGWVDAWKASPGDHFVEVRARYDAEADAVFDAPRRDDPNYAPPGAMEMTGELDFVTVLPDRVDVVDLKTGKKENSLVTQLRGYSVIAERKWRRPLVRSAFLYARKTKIDLTPWIEMDADALDAEAGSIRRQLRTLPTAERVKGDHCYRCPMGPRRGAGRPSPCPSWAPDEYVPIENPDLLDESVRLF